MARNHDNSVAAFSASQLAQALSLGEPTVGKILKMLTKDGIVKAKRGVNGGYQLTSAADSISLAQVISAVEGGPALTECSEGHDICSQDRVCALKTNWQTINQVVSTVLSNVTLADMNGKLCHNQLLSDILSSQEYEQPVHFLRG